MGEKNVLVESVEYLLACAVKGVIRRYIIIMDDCSLLDVAQRRQGRVKSYKTWNHGRYLITSVPGEDRSSVVRPHDLQVQRRLGAAEYYYYHLPSDINLKM